MNKLATAERAQVVAALIGGASMRSVARMTGVARNTIAKLLVDLGSACTKFQDERLRDLPCKRIKADEIWSFELRGELGVGDAWTFTAIDAETKLVPSWLVGSRDAGTATEFMRDLASRLTSRGQLTTDGLHAYLSAVEGISYYCAERANITTRMSMRRSARLTDAFSKKLENHCAAIALYFMHHNFARVHQKLRITPAMAAGVSDHAWEIDEIVALMDAPSATAQAG